MSSRTAKDKVNFLLGDFLGHHTKADSEVQVLVHSEGILGKSEVFEIGAQAL